MFIFGVLLLSFANAQTDKMFTSGAFTVQASTTEMFRFSSILGVGPFISMSITNSETTSVSVTVTWQLFATSFLTSDFALLNSGLANIGASVQSYAALSFLLQAGFTISTTPTNAMVSAVVMFPSPDAITANLLQQTNVNAGVLRYDSTTQAYFSVPCKYVQSPYEFEATLSPLAGQYAITAINQQVTVSTSAMIATVVAPANSNQTFGFAVVSTTAPDLKIKFQSSSQTNITCTPLMTPPQHSAPSQKGAWVNAYWNIKLSNTQAQHMSTVTYWYTDAQVQAAAQAVNVTTADATMLALYWADQGGAWMKADTTVDVSAKAATCMTTHFSDWSIYYKASGAAIKAQMGVLVTLIMLALYL